MLKLTIAVVFVSFVFICIMKENSAVVTGENQESSRSSSDNEYEPFIVATTIAGTLPKMTTTSPDALPKLSDYKLPSTFFKFRIAGWKLSSERPYIFEIPTCPGLETNAETAKVDLDALNNIIPDTEKCLFARHFKTNEPERCDKKPTPVLEESTDGNGSFILCGLDENQRLVDVHFYHCGTDDILIEYKSEVQEGKNVTVFKPQYFLMYQICYDFTLKKTLWTKHTPMTPALLENPESPYKNLSNEIPIADFSTDTSSLNLRASTFKGLKKSYESNYPDMSTIYTLVPKDHMALRYWKNATSHMINSAPLLPKFVPLIKAINNGILQASLYLFANGEETLQIYTQAETKYSNSNSLFVAFTRGINIVKSITRIESVTPVDYFEPNIWYSFVHNETQDSGVFIVLHNTAEELPEQKECSEEERLPCDFKNWSESPELIDDGILDHAYCCKIPEKQLECTFLKYTSAMTKTFDIQKTILAAQKERIKTESDGDKNDQ